MRPDPGPRFQPADTPLPLNNVATTDAYSAVNTLWVPGSMVLVLQVFNNAIYHQVGIGRSLESVQWLPEEYDVPSNYVLDDKSFDAVRVRSAVAGVPGRVTVRARKK